MNINIPARLRNPLNAYHTYSVSYQVVVTNSLEVAQQLTNPVVFEDFVFGSNLITDIQVDADSPDENVKQLRRMPGYVYSNNELIGEAIHLIDSNVDADFLIQSLEIETILNPTSVVGPSLGTQVEAVMRIHEPRSATFIDQLQYVFNLLNVNKQKTCLYFIIRPTINPSNMRTTLDDMGIASSNFVDDTDTRPIPMDICSKIMLDISCVFSTAGTDYEMQLIAMDNGYAALANNNTVVHNTSVKLDPNITLNQALKTLETSLNATYSRSIPKTDNTQNFVEYEYRIVVDTEYQSPSYKIDNVSPINTQTGKNDAILSFADGDVQRAILEVMCLSSKVLDDTLPANASKTMYETDIEDVSGSNVGGSVTIMDIFKPTVTSETFHDPAKPDKMILQFRVSKRQLTYTDQPRTDMLSIVQRMVDEKNGSISKHNIMIYDYIHTGKNVDVRRVDLALNNGTAFTVGVESISAMSTGITTLRDDGKLAVVNNDNMFVSNIVIPNRPSHVSNSIFVQESKRRKMYDALNKFAYVESIQFEIEVTGNPNLYNCYTAQQGMSFKATDSEALFRNIDKQPSLMFLNIMYPSSPNYWEPDAMPAEQTDRAQFIDSVSGDLKVQYPQLVPFWFRGLLQIMSIRTVFEGASFYHVMELYPLPSAEQQIERAAEETSKNNEQVAGGNNSLRGAANRVYTAALTDNDTFRVGGDNIALPNQPVPPEGATLRAAAGTPMAQNYITSSYSLARVITTKDRNGNKKVIGPKRHKGIDLRGAAGTPVYAIASGKIVSCNYVNGFLRNIIVIKHDTGHLSRYLHVDKVSSLKVGDVVSAGQKIATIANIKKDYNVGDHLHFEIAWKGVLYNPEQFITIVGAKPTIDVTLYFNDPSLRR